MIDPRNERRTTILSDGPFYTPSMEFMLLVGQIQIQWQRAYEVRGVPAAVVLGKEQATLVRREYGLPESIPLEGVGKFTILDMAVRFADDPSCVRIEVEFPH